jgi:hypothetical protein
MAETLAQPLASLPLMRLAVQDALATAKGMFGDDVFTLILNVHSQGRRLTKVP